MSTASNSVIADHNNLVIDIAMGNIPGMSTVNKFGHAPAGIDTSASDIYDNAATQPVWLAPTAASGAQIHQLASTSADDDKATGQGAWTARVWGLTSWDTEEVSEDVDLDGTVDSPTANSYVIIHRMRVIAHGANGNGVGTITATQDTDAKITASIVIGQGQTQMAIYGVPSGKTFLMEQFYLDVLRTGAAANVDVDVVCAENPAAYPAVFTSKHHASRTAGNQAPPHTFNPPKPFAGPCIIKIQGTSSALNTDVAGGFDGLLVTDILI